MSKFIQQTSVEEMNYEGSSIYRVTVTISGDLMRYYLEHQDLLVSTLVHNLAREFTACYESKNGKP